jgi:hypothetical protein
VLEGRVSRAVVVVWLGAASLRTVHEPDLASWAEARQVAVEDLAPERSLPGVDHDDTLATKIESLVSEAVSSGEPAEAESILSSAEELLRALPELAESAWLMAEIWRTRASLGGVDAEEAAALDRKADTLEGPRAPRYEATGRSGGNIDSGPDPAAAPRHDEEAAVVIGADGPLPTDDVFIDGILERRRAVPAGEHHYRIVRAGGLAWAGWADAAAAGRIRVPGAAPCTATDLGSVDASDSRVTLRHPVLCPEWAVVRSPSDDRIEVARCHASSCGTFLPWKREWGASFEGPVHSPYPQPKSNAWIFWTAVSVAAAATASVALWQSGLFEKEPEVQHPIEISPPGRNAK